MKIGIDAHGLGGRSLGAGNEQYSRQLIMNLLAIDQENEYHLFVNEPEALRPLIRQYQNARLVGLRPHSQWLQRPFSAPYYAWRHRLDVLHFPFVRPPFTHAKTVITVHDTLYETVPQFYTKLERTRMKTLIPWSCRNADLIFTISEFSRQQIHEHHGVPLDRIVVTPCAADHVETSGDNALSRRPADLPPRYICFLGTLQPRKNLVRLVRAFDMVVARSGIPHHLLLVGSLGWSSSDLVHAMQTAKHHDRIHVTGFISDQNKLNTILQYSELLACPSLAEGFSLPPIEAQRAGIPVVVSRTTCFPEIYADSAEYCDPLDEASIADAIQIVLQSEERRKVLVSRGFENAARFCWRRTARIALDAYRRLADEPPATPLLESTEKAARI